MSFIGGTQKWWIATVYSIQSATNRNTEPRFIAAILDWWRFITSGFFGFTSLALAFGSILTLVAASLSTVSLPGNPAYMLLVVSVKSHGGFTCSVFFCVCFPPPLPTRKMGERGREREREIIYIYKNFEIWWPLRIWLILRWPGGDTTDQSSLEHP